MAQRPSLADGEGGSIAWTFTWSLSSVSPRSYTSQPSSHVQGGTGREGGWDQWPRVRHEVILAATISRHGIVVAPSSSASFLDRRCWALRMMRLGRAASFDGANSCPDVNTHPEIRARERYRVCGGGSVAYLQSNTQRGQARRITELEPPTTTGGRSLCPLTRVPPVLSMFGQVDDSRLTFIGLV